MKKILILLLSYLLFNSAIPPSLASLAANLSLVCFAELKRGRISLQRNGGGSERCSGKNSSSRVMLEIVVVGGGF